VACGVAVVAAIATTILARNAPADWRIAAIGAGHAVAQLVGALALTGLMVRDLRRHASSASDGSGAERTGRIGSEDRS
jgi:hypothetical protein